MCSGWIGSASFALAAFAHFANCDEHQAGKRDRQKRNGRTIRNYQFYSTYFYIKFKFLFCTCKPRTAGFTYGSITAQAYFTAF